MSPSSLGTKLRSSRLHHVETRNVGLAKQAAQLRAAESKRARMAERIKSLEEQLEMKDRQLQFAENIVASTRAADEKKNRAIEERSADLEKEVQRLQSITRREAQADYGREDNTSKSVQTDALRCRLED